MDSSRISSNPPATVHINNKQVEQTNNENTTKKNESNERTDRNFENVNIVQREESVSDFI